MKKLALILLALTQFSTYSIEAFVKQTQSQFHDGFAETAAVFSGGDFALTVYHEDPETGFGCSFDGIKVSEGVYRDSEAKRCKIEVTSMDNSINISTISGSNCDSICGKAERLEVSGLIYQSRE